MSPSFTDGQVTSGNYHLKICVSFPCFFILCFNHIGLAL